MNCTKCGASSGDDWEQCGGSCPQPASPPHFGPGCDEAEFELIVAGEYFAGASGPRASTWASIQGYARDCDPSECEFFEVTRRRVEP